MNPVGVSDPDVIPDSQITASSTLEQLESVHPSFGRLHGNRGDGWCSQRHDSNDDWLQVYFGDVFTVCGVETQGHVNADIWVTAFKLSFSTDGGNWTTYAYDNGTDAVSHSFSVTRVFLFCAYRHYNLDEKLTTYRCI